MALWNGKRVSGVSSRPEIAASLRKRPSPLPIHPEAWATDLGMATLTARPSMLLDSWQVQDHDGNEV